jgi:hypothetical protein
MAIHQQAISSPRADPTIWLKRQPHTRCFLDRRGDYIADSRVEFLTLIATKGLHV